MVTFVVIVVIVSIPDPSLYVSITVSISSVAIDVTSHSPVVVVGHKSSAVLEDE